MFSNIGGKLKGGAIALFILGALGTLITGIVFVTNRYTETIGILLIVLGPLLSWFSSWALYGFGELISKTTEIAHYAKYIAENSAAPAAGAAPIQRKPVPPPVSQPAGQSASNQANSLLQQGLITPKEYEKITRQSAPTKFRTRLQNDLIPKEEYDQMHSHPVPHTPVQPAPAPAQKVDEAAYRRRSEIQQNRDNTASANNLEELLAQGLITREEYDQLARQ